MTDTHQEASQPAVPGAGAPALTPNGQSPSGLVTAAPLTAAQLALYTGWTMAVLYGRDPVSPDGQPPARLAESSGARPDRTAGEAAAPAEPPELLTVNELPAPNRRTVELGRLEQLLKCLARLPDCPDLSPGIPGKEASDSVFKAGMWTLHLNILGMFAAAGLPLQLAYELGISLRDTVNPPADNAAAITRQLARPRIAKLQEWLATLAAEFPDQVAAIVAASIGRWSDFAEVTMGPPASTPGKASSRRKAWTRRKMSGPEFTGHMQDYLLQQGDIWLMLLIGARSTSGLLTAEGYVAAGEAALRRSARIIRGVVAHYWGALIFLAAALGGILYLAVTRLHGASQVWTSIAAIGSTLGISAQSIRSTIIRLSTEAERPVLAAAEEDVKAWAITTMPPARLGPGGVTQLRRAGIAKPVSLGRF